MLVSMSCSMRSRRRAASGTTFSILRIPNCAPCPVDACWRGAVACGGRRAVAERTPPLCPPKWVRNGANRSATAMIAERAYTQVMAHFSAVSRPAANCRPTIRGLSVKGHDDRCKVRPVTPQTRGVKSPRMETS
jgi:hypothetical protein